ncbi:hypothetical protein IMSAGC005_02101 [Lachnospiraceae bacterium]|nr:hypothetical protein IMSAGC005_02101 [Lachnospiraceae bacterium]
MFCSNCGKEINGHANFCNYCGTPVHAGTSSGTPSPEISAPTIPKKGISPVFIGIVSAVILSAAVVAGSVFYFTTRNNDRTQETVASESAEEESKTENEAAPVQETDGKEDTPSDSAAAELLQDYLETNLIPQYGSANLGAQTKIFDYDNVYAVESENQFWTASAGISDAKIYDLDQDGSEELLVFLLTEEDITFYIYEAENNEVRQAAAYSQERYSDMDGFDLSWSLFHADGTPYLFCHESHYGIIFDFSDTNARLYRYDGSQLLPALTIEQTAGGSSDFAYTAYQYDPEGKLVNEEVIYDETLMYLDEEDNQLEHYFQRIAEFFDAYGIDLDSEAALQEDADIYQGIAEMDGYETLLHLEMWGDYRYEETFSSVTYHFNDFDSPLSFYRRFLAGEETVQIREDAWYTDRQQSEWSLNDILNELTNTYLEGTDRRPYVEHAYLDCGGDGVEELAIRFTGLDIYSPEDMSNLIMIITCSNGTPEVVYSCESWARSYTEPHYHGCIPSSGSAGAGDHIFGLEYLDGSNNLHPVYYAQQLGGLWIRDLEGEIYDTVFSSVDPDADVTHYQINGADYYVMHSYDTSIDSLCQEYISLCEQKGMRFVSEEEIDELITQYAKELGIEDAWLDEEELSWGY